jgi:hypothetical protein
METSNLGKQRSIKSSKFIINVDISLTIIIIKSIRTIEQFVEDKRLIQRLNKEIIDKKLNPIKKLLIAIIEIKEKGRG